MGPANSELSVLLEQLWTWAVTNRVPAGGERLQLKPLSSRPDAQKAGPSWLRLPLVPPRRLAGRWAL